MSNIRNIETNPTKAIPIDKEQTINRLEKIKNKCDKFANAMGFAYIGSAAGVSTAVVSSLLLPTAVVFNTPVGDGIAATFLASGAVLIASYAGLAANNLISKKVESKLKSLQKQVNPKAYIEKILKKEQKRLKVCEEAANGAINIKTLRDAGIDVHSINSIEKFTGEASKKLREEEQKVAILESARDFMVMGMYTNKESILELLDLAENPIENRDAIQKIVSLQQTSVNEVTKSATQGNKER